MPGWLPEHEQVFGWLLQHAEWHQRTRVLWEQEMLEPRLTAFLPGALPSVVEELRWAVSDRLGVEFDSCMINRYRDGNDAVAWHGDIVRKNLVNPLVVTVSLGSARRFLVRRRGGGPVLRSTPQDTATSW